ncbi:hypothetical protein GCM10009849_05200 [Sinomonas flava]|uniref:Uncharacterized protein n=2 Tax=Sinomonas flava TaxID=496857 RepID=A0ABN3BJT3_9MICC
MQVESERTPFINRVRAVGYVRDEDMAFEALVLADEVKNPRWSLEFQRPLDPDDQDRILGLDTYCLVFPSGETAYQCLARVQISKAKLRLVLTEEAAARLGLTTSLDFILELSPTDFEEMTAGLRGILKGQRGEPLIVLE